ncbi:MAG: DNRLRE domain-containing protein [Terrisporobacter othiniensis]|uniref:DNRLRE domain-containing protein n=1 Tax=Terrisporobacter othiniensis TaxID=1577792 RepID=UPI002A74A728|nr:DNRLRE domain-containing protein [Terrisporobacter othiniensis]MDY3374185.1 DNRLRE domain-containing protein [Terrisporobacter othiniensis]
MKKRFIQKIGAIFMALCICVTYMPMGVFAEQTKEISQKLKERGNEVIESDNKSDSAKIIEKTENSTIYQLDGGMKREVIHDSNIRFKENGKLIDYDPSLVKIEDNKTENNTDISEYAYENNRGDKKNYIPESISEETPIILENNNYQITISPTEKETKKVKVEDENVLNIYDEEIKLPVKAIYEAEDEKSSLEYISKENGIKENIILNEVPDSNVFEYEIKLEGSKPKKCELEESIVFIDNETNEVIGSIDVPFMNDASNKAYSEEITYDINPKSGEEDTYILTMTVDEDYLKSEDRQYPVKIDPTITWSGDSNIIDTYIISGTKYGDINFYDSGTTAFPVGRGSNGIYRSLIKGRKLASTVDGKYVHKATLTMYETSNNDASNIVRAYRIIDNWSEKTVTWNSKPRYNTSDGYYGTVTSTGTLYKARVMDLTNYARKVANKSITDHGLMLKSSDEGTTTGKYSKFFGSRHSGTDIRPKFTVEYYDGPTTASSVKLSSNYLKVGQTFKLDWSGINSKSLNRIEYRIASYNDSDGAVGSDIFKYADSPSLGKTSSGSSDIAKVKELAEGCYRIYVRGVDNGGIKGAGKGATFHVDSTKPTLGSVSISPSSTEANPSESFTPTITWSNANDTHFKQVEYSVNSGTYAVAGTAKSGSLKLPSSKFPSEGTYTIKLRSVDKSGNVSNIKTLTYYLKDKNTDLKPYLPKNLSSSNYYGKSLISWDKIDDLPGNISYKVYRGETENFVPSDTNLVASGIKDSYCYDMLVGDGKTYYYKVEVIKTKSDGKEEDTDVITASIKSSVNDKTEWSKRLGNKGYLGYFSYETPNGNGTIEKSKGNLTYSQTDIELPSSQVNFALERNYNSQSRINNMFGIGWSDSFHKELYKIGANGDIVFRESDGSMYKFSKNTEGNYTCDETKDYELIETDKTEKYETEDKEGKTEIYELKHYYEITTKDNTIYRFNKSGQLIAITNPVEQVENPYNTFLIYAYDNKGRLSKVMSNSTLAIDLKYKSETGSDALLLSNIKLPDETTLSYNYENNYLTEFKHSSGIMESVSYKFNYNTNKYLSEIKDAEGNPYSIRYTGEKANIVTYPNGETYNLVYTSGTKTSMTKKNENKVEVYTESTEFDSNTGKIIKETDVSGNIKEFLYNNSNEFLVTSTKETVQYQELDGSNIVKFKTKILETNNEYDSNENVSKEIDEEGNVTTYNYNNSNVPNKPTSIITKASDGIKTISEENYEYDNCGNIIKETDTIGKTITEYKYDDKGNNTNTKEQITSNGKNSNGLITSLKSTTSYDENGNEITQSETSANLESDIKNEYDVMGRVIKSTDTKSGEVKVYTYDFLGRVTKTSTTMSGQTKIETKSYNKNGTVVEETDVDGIRKSYTFDSLNRVLTTSMTKGSNSLNTKNEYTYGNVSIYTGKGKENVSNVYIERTYTNNKLSSEKYIDKAGNTIREKIDGIYTDYTYDNKGNAITTFVIGVNESDSSKGKLSLSLYDENGKNTVNIVNPAVQNNEFKADDNSIVTKTVYDEKGNESITTDGNGVETTYNYDDSSRVTKVISASNKTEKTETNIQYDIFNDDGTISTKIMNANGNSSYDTSNVAGLQVEVKDIGSSNNITTKFEYDESGNKTKELFTNGAYKEYKYNAKNLLTETIYYDEEGIRTLKTDYVYDDNDKLTSMVDSKFNGNDEAPYHYTYYEYDDFRRLVGYSEVNSSSKPSTSVINKNKIVYTYDVNDRVTDINYPDSNDEVKGLKFIYNDDGWLTKIQAKIKKNFLINTINYREYSYHTDGKVKNIKEYRNFESQDDYILKTYEYDVFDRVTSMKYIDSSNLDKVMESYSYTYDKNNNIKSKKVVNNYPVKDSDKINETKKYTYDALGRLVKTDVTNHSTGKNSSITYGYDKVGNRTSMTKDGVTTSYKYNELNQLTSSVENKDGKETSNKAYTYDANGNQTKEKDSVTNITVENTYDADNRLSTSITVNGTKEVVNQENLYNGNGKRIQKKEGNNVVNYFYQDGVVLYTSDKDGNKTSQNFVGIDGNVIGTTRYGSEGFKYYTYNKDVQGSTTSVVGEDGISPVAYDYDDFGVTTTIGDSSFFNEVCYTGGIYDVSTGLYYLNARYYNPRNGRFITRDTYRGEINNPSTLHLYAYCANNPINFTDPSGHYSQAIKEPTGIRIIRGLVNAVLIGAAIIYNGVTWVKATVAKTSKKYTYYKAMIKDYQVYMSDGISKSAAISRLKKNQDVWTKKKYNAFTIAKAATDKGATVKGPECHLKNKNGKQIPRFYYHYHARYLSSNRVQKQRKSHALYGSAQTNPFYLK